MSGQTEQSKGVFERALGNLRKAWQGIAGAGFDAEAAGRNPGLPDATFPISIPVCRTSR